MKKFLILAAFLAFPTALHAGSHSGNDLLNVCTQTEQRDMHAVACQYYVRGVVDSAEAVGQRDFCLPLNTPFTQVADIAVKWLRDHPEERQYVAAVLVAQSLFEAFPCEKKPALP